MPYDYVSYIENTRIKQIKIKFFLSCIPYISITKKKYLKKKKK